MASVAVIGGGVGGLSAAIRLAASGHEVTVYERRSVIGGKLASESVDGFHFDVGPSLLTLPHVFEELFAAAGESLHDHVELVRLANICRYRFPDGTTVDVSDDAERSALAWGEGADDYRSFLAYARRSWETSERTFFTGPMDSPLSLLRRMRSPRDFLDIDPLRTVDSVGRRFTDPRMRLWLNRYATYSGSSPYEAPATLACIPWIEQHYGAWHVMGGLSRLAEALTELATRLGVTLRTGVDVEKIHTEGGVVHGVEYAGERVPTEVVVANCDAEHLYSDLLPTPSRLRRTRQAGRSSSGFALLLGLRGRTDGLDHHNIWFSADQRQEFAQIFDPSVGVADDPTVYVCSSSITDASAAPVGDENWFVLVNVGPGADTNWAAYGDRLIERLGVGDRIAVRRHMTPADYAARYRAPGGAIYGTSSNGRRSAFLRAGNRGPLKGLYLAGGSAHPGGGLPLVAMSGGIVADMINKDFS